MKKYKNLILIILVIALAVIPLIILRDAEFQGADSKAKEVIAGINTDFKPWAKPVWEPPSGEVETLLFALQAAIGAGFIGYFIGLTRGRNEKK